MKQQATYRQTGKARTNTIHQIRIGKPVQAMNEVWQIPIKISKPLVQANVVQKLFQQKKTMNNCMILNCLSRCQIASIAAVLPFG